MNFGQWFVLVFLTFTVPFVVISLLSDYKEKRWWNKTNKRIALEKKAEEKMMWENTVKLAQKYPIKVTPTGASFYYGEYFGQDDSVKVTYNGDSFLIEKRETVGSPE